MHISIKINMDFCIQYKILNIIFIVKIRFIDKQKGKCRNFKLLQVLEGSCALLTTGLWDPQIVATFLQVVHWKFPLQGIGSFMVKVEIKVNRSKNNCSIKSDNFYIFLLLL